VETKNWSWGLKIVFILLFSSTFTVFHRVADAQIKPDNTLGTESSSINTSGQGDIIEGGAIRGSNLFHSFEDFNVSAQQRVDFANPSGIQNIISRITGGKSSEILGTLGVLGNANLFLINPNGIVFGPNARLNLQGSFIASTADSIIFDNGLKFSATHPQALPLLKINVPIGLQFGPNPGNILVQGLANNNQNVGLQVSPGQTLGLVGGDIRLDDAYVSTAGGNILLGSVTSPGLVSFIPSPTGWSLDYTGVANFGNIELSGTATARELNGGAIQIRGGKVSLRDRSNLFSDTVTNIDGRGITVEAAQFQLQDQAFFGTTTYGTGAGGNVVIHATDSVELSGIGFDNFQRNYLEPALSRTLGNSLPAKGFLYGVSLSTGKAGDIIIDTKKLTVENGAAIINLAFTTGDGGNIIVRTSDLVDVNSAALLTTAFNLGNAGSITVDTGKLTVRDSGVLSTATLGAGNSGDLTVNASESVVLSGNFPGSRFATALSTNTAGSTGNAGNLEINTGSLLLEEGATITSSSGLNIRNLQIPSEGRGGNLTINARDSVKVIGRSDRSFVATGTLGQADGGDLKINTRRLIVQDGGGVGASTVGAGRGGNIFINATESVQVIGKTRDNSAFSAVATASGDILIKSPSGKFTGAAGELNITTGKLILQDQGSVSVESLGSGRAGTINIVADAIALDNQSSIDGNTRSGSGGNIHLQAGNILLRRQSRISTNAGSFDGGNITINTDTLAAAENSDITANSTDFRGGNITINTQGIFGIAFREQQTPQSDITATGRNSQLQGVVQINILSVDPTQGLTQLPSVPNDPTNQIVAGCPAERGARFVVTGRGGLPEDPRQMLHSQVIMQDWRVTTTNKNLPIPTHQSPLTNPQSPIVEAQGWVINREGNVELVTNFPQNSPSFRDDQMKCTQLPRDSRQS
jgi:filamentous hemagglutinin family protein